MKNTNVLYAYQLPTPSLGHGPRLWSRIQSFPDPQEMIENAAMSLSFAEAIQESDVRSACVDVLGVHDAFYTQAETLLLPRADSARRDAIAASLRDARGEALITLCEDIVRQVRTASTRHDRGVVYTPQGVVDMMMDEANPAAFDTIIDMGCGCGRFSYAAKRAAPEADVVGVDVDPLACLLSATVSAVTGAAFGVRRMDFLALNGPTNGRTLYVGNPPYVRHHKLTTAQKDLGRSLATQAGLRHWSALSGLYALFMAKVLATAAPGDRMVAITGAEWMDVGYGKSLRDAFASSLGGGTSLISFPAATDLFDGAMSTALISCWDIKNRTESIRLEMVDGVTNRIPVERLHATPKWGGLLGKTDGTKPKDTVPLGELFRVSRGIVTGNNAYFVRPFDDRQALSMGPRAVPVVARASDIPETGTVDPRSLKKRLLMLDPEVDQEYLLLGEEAGIPKGYVASHRSEWFRITTKPAPILATYMRRGRPRFALNPSRCPNLNTVHGLYPKVSMVDDDLRRIVEYLNTGDTYGDSGRTYQGGLVKFEPREMERIEIPVSVVQGLGEDNA